MAILEQQRSGTVHGERTNRSIAKLYPLEVSSTNNDDLWDHCPVMCQACVSTRSHCYDLSTQIFRYIRAS